MEEQLNPLVTVCDPDFVLLNPWISIGLNKKIRQSMILCKLFAPTKKLPQEVQVDQTLRPLEGSGILQKCFILKTSHFVWSTGPSRDFEENTQKRRVSACFSANCHGYSFLALFTGVSWLPPIFEDRQGSRKKNSVSLYGCFQK